MNVTLTFPLFLEEFSSGEKREGNSRDDLKKKKKVLLAKR